MKTLSRFFLFLLLSSAAFGDLYELHDDAPKGILHLCKYERESDEDIYISGRHIIALRVDDYVEGRHVKSQRFAVRIHTEELTVKGGQKCYVLTYDTRKEAMSAARFVLSRMN